MSGMHSPPDVPWPPEETIRVIEHPASPDHYHEDSKGRLHACYHNCRNSLTSWGFWVGLTLGFPIEHLLWEKAWPFYLLTHALGL